MRAIKEVLDATEVETVAMTSFRALRVRIAEAEIMVARARAARREEKIDTTHTVKLYTLYCCAGRQLPFSRK